MDDVQTLKILVKACDETLGDAHGGDTWLVEMLPQLERLRRRLKSELDALT